MTEEKNPLEATKEYIVVEKGLSGFKVGEKIKCTDRRAKNLVGKIRLASDHEKKAESQSALVELRKDLDKANFRGKEFEKEIKRLTSENQKLSKEVGSLKAEMKKAAI